LLRKDNKVAVFNRGGDSILSHSTRSLGSSVQDACNAITKDWPTQAATAVGSASSEPTVVQTAATTSKPAGVTRIAVSSNPDKADIEVDGNFVGSTPSSVELAQGAHVIRVTKSGYSRWQRTLNVGTSSVNVSAELEKAN